MPAGMWYYGVWQKFADILEEPSHSVVEVS
jgi:hypothetical protein